MRSAIGGDLPQSQLPACEPASFSEIVNRIPGGSRFATLTDPPNNERMRNARGGLSHKSPPGVTGSPIDNRSKNFANKGVGIIRPLASKMTFRESCTASL